ncbi:MAG TPA: hypothetical protein VNB49_14755 [Candidatus Dormibacteraeota bacterium]|nr:hypothetical protein [Candidatus Dormibacteraeota bacterium]
MNKRYALLVVCFAFASASAVRAQNSGVNNAELIGNYAFTFAGGTGTSGSFAVFAAVGRFTADGAGNLTNGVLDSNGGSAGSVFTAQPFTGTYTIGADNRGSLSLHVAGGTATYAFAMRADGGAEFIRFDASGGTGTIGSGTIEKADSSAFSVAQISGDYAFGLEGFEAAGRVAFAGRMTSDGAGNFSNVASDADAEGSFGPVIFTTATYTVTDTTSGRGTMSWTFDFFGTSYTFHYVFYVVNSKKLLLMGTDSFASSLPILTGPMVQQQIPAGGFSNASLNGGMVLSLRGSCTSGAAAPVVFAGLLTGDGGGNFTLSFDENCGGTVSSNTGLSGTYAVAANGRIAFILDGSSDIAYLTAPNQLFFLASGAESFIGPGEGQQGGAFSNSTLAGNYAGFSTLPQTPAVKIFSGEFSADGASPSGKLTGAVDFGDASGPISGAAFAATYSISSAPINGRGTVTITSPAGTNAVAYVISPTEFVLLPLNDANPSLWRFEQAPSNSPPSAVTLTSLTLSPTTVVGGQSSTATVTLSGPAPSGGAQITLSSSDTATAQVPPSGNVTVPAGATSASFTVTTSAAGTSTSVAISAAYSGVTQTATLTVTPPPPTLTTLTLNPSSVIGGLQSSTGTVTLSGPAPADGVVVALSSSNPGVAQVPSSGNVIIPAGATSASFTVTTSLVLIPTSAKISASYNGATRTASLGVL